MSGGSKVITQIYEIQTPREAEAVIALGVDHIGSVLLSKEDWKVSSVRQVGETSRKAGRAHSVIPLFEDINTLLRTIDYYRPDLLHFCDALDGKTEKADAWKHHVETQARIKKQYPTLRLMRSIPIPPPSVKPDCSILDLAREFEAVSDYLLIDTWSADTSPFPYIGITGRTCNWDTAKKLVTTSRLPVVLAGGLSPENVYQAVKRVKPFGVDSCTMTNLRDENGTVLRFKKDLKRVKSFMDEVRRAERDFPR